MKAVILAAGQGLRIRQHHALPKGFIEIDNKPIILHSLEKLRKAGITDILLVTGFGHEHYQQLAEETGWFSTVYNEHFSDYGSLYSLYCAREWLDSDFLLLESDLLYESMALTQVLNFPQANVILVSGTTHSGDEVYVCAQDDNLISMSKSLQSLDSDLIVGEFVGVNKLSLLSYQVLLALLAENSSLLHTGNYEEQGLVALAQTDPVYCLKYQALKWCEIDNLAHLERAQKLYPDMKLV